MSRWADSFNNLAIHKTIENAFVALDFDTSKLESTVAAEHRRLVKAFEFLKTILDGMNPELSPDAQLNNLANHLNGHVVGQIQNFASNKNVQHLKNANDQFTPQIGTIFQLVGLSKPAESRKAIRGVEAAYDNFCKAVEKTKDEFAETAKEKASEISDLETRTIELSSSLESLRQTTEGQISTWQTEFTEAQTTRAEEHSEAQIEPGKRI